MNMNTFCVTGNCYLPQPPRAWSRVQNSCSVIAPTDDNELVQVPYTTEVVPYAELGPMLAMINKGNVLQYKKNSSNLTQWQKYSLIAKGQWVNRTTTWASQSTRGYTNPNTQSLLRVGGTNVTLNGAVPTDLPVTCPRFPIIHNNVLPSNGGGGISNPPLPPPPPPPTPGGGTVIPIIPVAPIIPIVIPDFGNLVCGTKENLCTGEIFESIKLDNCHPTTDSDVPGTIQDLCWNDGNPTWYPRQRYVMSNSTDKWPVNAIVGSAVKPSTPILSVITNCKLATLSWNFDFECLPITSYNIYQNGEFIANINGSANSYSVFLDAGTYSFSIIGVNNGIFSDISNVVTITIIYQPLILSIETVCNIATLSWNKNSDCDLTYQIWKNGEYLATVNTNTYVVTLQENVPYEFYIIELIGSGAFEQSNTVSITFQEFSTNGVKSTTNPLSNDPDVTGYTYILFNDSNKHDYFFTSNCGISELYYMIVGPGGTGQSGFTADYYSIGGTSGGAGGIWNGVTNLSIGNYSITIPAVDNASPTIIQNSSDLNIFNITAESGSFTWRGGVTQTVSSVNTPLSLPSNIDGEFGVGGQPSQVTQGVPGSNPFVFTAGTPGGVVLQSPSFNNYITFIGDLNVSNKFFGGGGGGGGTGGNKISLITPMGPNHPATIGYDGGGGGGGGGIEMNGGQGTNGLYGDNGGDYGGNGGNAFTSSQGYGGGGGGGGSVLAGGPGPIPWGNGGTGGPAMLMIYFVKQL